MTRYRVTNDRTGEKVQPGDTVTDFEGNEVIFIEVTRGLESGLASIVRVRESGCPVEYHAQVFRLTVETLEDSSGTGTAADEEAHTEELEAGSVGSHLRDEGGLDVYLKEQAIEREYFGGDDLY